MKTLFALALAIASTPAALHAQGTPTAPDPGSDSQPAPAIPIALANKVPLCTANQISISTDDEGGNFSGMQQSGTVLVLRNFGSGACRFPAIPHLEMLGKNGPLNISATMDGFPSPGMGSHMGHGPAVPPVIVAGGAELTSTLHWVSGPVYDHNVCLDITSMRLSGSDGNLTTAFSAHICGERGKPITFHQSRFAPDPVFKPGKPGPTK